MTDRVSRALRAFLRIATPAAHLGPEERARLEEERIEMNRARTAGVLPVLVAIQIVLLFVYQQRQDGLHAAFRAGVFWIHMTSLPVIATLSAAAWVAPQRKLRLWWLGDVVLIVGVGLGLVLSLNTHRLVPNLNALTVALFAGTVVVRPTLFGALLAYGGAATGVVLGLDAVQPDSELRTQSLTGGVATVLLTFALSRVIDASLVRDVLQRLTIARQKSELQAWNAELERRVRAQVTETLAHANEARRLDAQLRWNVRERSRELTLALRSAPSTRDGLLPGTRFEHRFGIEGRIGEGAMGDVYAARDHASGLEVAIKVLRQSEEMSREDIERFLSEGAAAATVVHPAIVRTYHVDITEDGHFYLVMERVRGRTLAEEIARGRFDAAQTARLGSVVADALVVAHAAGVVHRDIKPGNLMLTTEEPGVRVLDFGVSKLADAEAAESTAAGRVVGTPEYMAPEQIVRTGRVTGACDVYALGQVLYEMLAGEPCFRGKTVHDVLRSQVADAPISLRSRTGDAVPEDLAGLIGQCLEKVPELRPSAESLAAALRVIADTLGAPPLWRIGPPPRAKIHGGASDIGAPTVRVEE